MNRGSASAMCACILILTGCGGSGDDANDLADDLTQPFDRDRQFVDPPASEPLEPRE